MTRTRLLAALIMTPLAIAAVLLLPTPWLLALTAVVFLAALVRATWGFGDAVVGIPLLTLLISLSKRSEATSSPPLTAMQPDAFNSRHRSRVKLFSKRTLDHQLTTSLRRMISSASAFISAGGAASSTK